MSLRGTEKGLTFDEALTRMVRVATLGRIPGTRSCGTTMSDMSDLDTTMHV